MTQICPFEISHGDFIEINMATENERPVAPWTMERVYEIFNHLKPGDTIVVTPELPLNKHYGRNFDDISF